MATAEEVNNPDAMLRKLLDRFPDPFWNMNPKLQDLRQQAMDAVSQPFPDKERCRELFFEISRSRHE